MFVLVVDREPIVAGFWDEIDSLARGLLADGVRNVCVQGRGGADVPSFGELQRIWNLRPIDLVCRHCGAVYHPSSEPPDHECYECGSYNMVAACQGCQWLVGDSCNGTCEDGFPLRAEEF